MIDIESTRWSEHGKRFDDVKLTYSQLKVLNFLAQNMNRLVSFADIENAFAPKSGSTNFHKWNHRVHITEIKKAIRPHGFDILSKSGFGYKLIDTVSPMNDTRDEFEIIYATRHLSGDTESMKTLRNDAGGYDYSDHIQDCFYIYLMALGAKS